MARACALAFLKCRNAKVKTSGRSEEEAAKDANRALLKLGKYDATITEVSEYISDRGNETFKCIVVVGDRTLTDHLTDTKASGLRLRHCCAARGVLAKFEAGFIEASDLPGPVRVKIGIRKGTRAYPGDRNEILDYEAVASSVVNLRAAG
jgi:hypothetical protein